MFVGVMIDNKSTVNTKQVIEEIKSILDALVKDKQNRPPLLIDQEMNSRFNYIENKDRIEEDTIEKCLEDMEDTLNDFSDNDTEKKEFLAALNHLHQELSKKTRVNYLVDSLLGYLNQIDNLKPLISRLRTLI
jgi:hypothetical protein